MSPLDQTQREEMRRRKQDRERVPYDQLVARVEALEKTLENSPKSRLTQRLLDHRMRLLETLRVVLVIGLMVALTASLVWLNR